MGDHDGTRSGPDRGGPTRGQGAHGRRGVGPRARRADGPTLRVKALPALPRLHAVTDERIARRPDLDRVAQQLAPGGCEDLAFHARGRALSGLGHYELAVRLSACPPAPLFVNDRLDVALGARAAGGPPGPGSLRPQGP